MKKSSRQKFLLSLFGGLFGIDKFYEGNFKLGLLKLFTIGGYGIWWIIDIILAYKELENKEAGIILKNIFKPIGYIFLGFIVLFIFLAIIIPNNPNSQIVENTKVEDHKEEVSLNIKKDIYYIYWQSEHIASGLTFKKYLDGGKQEERDEFFKNTKLEYEKKLTSDRGIDYEIYKKYSLELGFGEGNDKDWERPNSNSDDVLIYVYGEEKFNLFKATKNFLNKKGNFNKSYSSCIGLASMNYNGTVGPQQYVNIIKVDDTHININTYVKGKNAFGQVVKENFTCMYEYNSKSQKYIITGIK